MNGGRVTLLVTGLIVAGLAVLFLVLRWEDANKVATSVSALAGATAVGVAVWAAWPAVPRPGVRVTRTGKATAGATGKANTGYAGGGGPVPPGTSVDRTGDAEGGDANTGIETG
ncbi:hypothetical protein GCM10010402_12690 [Actinomadura luteofluorescens]